ncbi:MAG TPA: DUF4912 domain-containing protein [Verrucomicrobiae bacterium]|nr:DUF4912 domain-containing protein [Verrucomicrobiae bacterium]
MSKTVKKSDATGRSSSGSKSASRSASAPATPASKAPKSGSTAIGSTAKRKSVPPIPAILLEGDEPSIPPTSGPGERYALGPVPAAEGEGAGGGELPEAYGTQRLLLTARDPHWLYAHWDLTRDQLRRYNSRSVDRHLVLRVYRNELSGEPHREVHVHPESRNWFAHVGVGGTKYIAELGYYRPNDQWVRIATSATTVTPPETMSDDLSVWFETLPMDMRFEEIIRLVKAAVSDNVPLMEAIQQLRASGHPGLPDGRRAGAGRWTREQEEALTQVVSMDAVRRIWMGSLEITELIRRQFLQELSSQAVAQLGQMGSWSGAVSSFSSPFGGLEQRKGFWFNVNAELIIYGATEPDATVTIGGRTIRLRPDGTFSYRFSLPDGQYDLPAVATSADGTDSRSAGLKFSRTTQYQGDVQKHPQDPSLRPPSPEHVA